MSSVSPGNSGSLGGFPRTDPGSEMALPIFSELMMRSLNLPATKAR